MENKILVLTSTFPRYKGDTSPPFVYELSKRLTKNNKIFVLAPFSPKSKMSETVDKMKIYRFRYWFDTESLITNGAMLPNLSRNKFYLFQVPFFVISQFINLVKIGNKEKINTIHAHWILPQGLVAVIYKKIFNKNIKIIITSHGGDIFGLQKFNFLKRWIINNSSGVTVVSNAIKDKLIQLKIKNDNVKVIPMGVDLSKFNPKNYSDQIKRKYKIKGPFLLFVGRLTEKKGVQYLIKAMPLIIKKYPRTKLLIVGGGEMQDKLIKLTKKLEMEKYIIFTGPKPNDHLPKYYATADIFIGPSIRAKNNDTEGFGLVFVESIGSGCLTVASELPSIKDIIKKNKTGFFVKEKDSLSISNTVIKLIEKKNNLKKFRYDARNYMVNNFDWEIISKKYEKVLT